MTRQVCRVHTKWDDATGQSGPPRAGRVHFAAWGCARDETGRAEPCPGRSPLRAGGALVGPLRAGYERHCVGPYLRNNAARRPTSTRKDRIYRRAVNVEKRKFGSFGKWLLCVILRGGAQERPYARQSGNVPGADGCILRRQLWDGYAGRQISVIRKFSSKSSTSSFSRSNIRIECIWK